MTDEPTAGSPGAAVNPYAPPQASITPQAAEAPEDAEAIRRQFLNHEASIRAIGGLYIFSAVLVAFATVVIVIMGFTTAETPPEGAIMVGLGLAYGLFGWFSFYLGRGLRRLDSKVRLGTTILTVIGLIGIPIGTIINAYILWLLHSAKGKRVMTPEYQSIVAQTPHIKYRTPVWLLILAVLLVVLLVAIFVIAFQA